MRTEIIYEDKSLIVCYKPAGLAVQTAKVGQADVVSELKNYLCGNKMPYLGVVHRLDQPVEGMLVFAKNANVAAELSRQLTADSLNKHYYAVVCGKPDQNTDRLVDYLAKTQENMAVVRDDSQDCRQLTEKTRYKQNDLKYKEAVLSYRLCQSRRVNETDCEADTENTISLMDIRIETGRFHQIRAQMSHAGMPLLGDKKYGNELSLKISRELGVTSVALCAYSIEFVHPETGKTLMFKKEPKGSIFGSFCLI